MSQSGCAGKSWGPRPDPPSAAGRTRAPQGPPAPPAGTRDLGAPRHPSLQGQGCVTSRRDKWEWGAKEWQVGVFVPTFAAAHRVTLRLGHLILRSPLPWLSQGYPIPASGLGGATRFPQSWLFPVGMHSPLGRGLEPCPAGWDPGSWCPHGAQIKGIPHYREQIPPGCPGRAFSRLGFDPT